MTNEVSERGLTVYVDRFGEEKRLSFPVVRKFLIQGRAEYVTDPEIAWFIAKCKALKLNPFTRDCYLVKYSQKENAQIVVSKDFYNARLDSQKDLEWWQAGIIVKRECKPCNGTGLIDVPNGPQAGCEACDNEGSIYKNRQGAMTRDGDFLVGGYFEAKKRGRTHPNYLEVSLPAYIKTTREGNVTSFWRPEMQPHMIRKVAFSQGSREMYPDEYGGMYDQAEVSLEEPLPEDTITLPMEELEPVRDVVGELNVEAAAAEAAPVEAAAAEQTEEQFHAALVKTFDSRTEDLDQDMVRDYMFQAMQTLGVESIPAAKVIIMRDRLLDKLIEEIRVKMEPDIMPTVPPGDEITYPPVEEPTTAEEKKVVEHTEPPAESPPVDPPPTEPPAEKPPLDREALLSRIKTGKTGTLIDIVNEFYDELINKTMPRDVEVELGAKLSRLTKKSLEVHLEEIGSEEREIFKSRVRQLQTQAVEKCGKDKAEMLYYEVLGAHGASNIGEVYPSAYEAVLADYKAKIEHEAMMSVPPDASATS